MHYIFGSWFDPFTHAHEEIIKTIHKKLRQNDKFHILVTDNDEKKNRTSVEERCNMVRNALAARNIKKYELYKQNNRMYEFISVNFRTVDPKDITIVIGEDEWASLLADKWKFSKRLLKYYKFIIFTRKGSEKDWQKKYTTDSYDYTFMELSDKVQDVSSLWEGGWSPEDSQMLKNHFCRETTEPNKSEKQSAAQEPSQNSANGKKVDPDFDPFGGAFGEMFSNIFGQKTASQPTEMESPKFISGVFTDKKTLKEAIIHNISAFGSNIDLNSMDVSQVTDMSDLFSSWPAAGFNGDISKWDVSHVTNMDCMFQHSEFNGDISQWDVSHVTSMKCMFRYSKFNGDISSWDVSHVTNMQWLFCGSAFHGDVSKWHKYILFSSESFSPKEVNQGGKE